VKDLERMVDALVARGLQRDTNVVSHVRADGKHSEWFWRREFPDAYQWLFSPDTRVRGYEGTRVRGAAGDRG
jgi:hypothetical protein